MSLATVSSTPVASMISTQNHTLLRNMALSKIIFGEVKLSENQLKNTGVSVYLNNLFIDIANAWGAKVKDFEFYIGVAPSDTSLDKVQKAFRYVMGTDGFDREKKNRTGIFQKSKNPIINNYIYNKKRTIPEFIALEILAKILGVEPPLFPENPTMHNVDINMDDWRKKHKREIKNFLRNPNQANFTSIVDLVSKLLEITPEKLLKKAGVKHDHSLNESVELTLDYLECDPTLKNRIEMLNYPNRANLLNLWKAYKMNSDRVLFESREALWTLLSRVTGIKKPKIDFYDPSLTTKTFNHWIKENKQAIAQVKKLVIPYFDSYSDLGDTLPPEITLLPNLEHLDLRLCGIRLLPDLDTLYQLKNLKILYIRDGGVYSQIIDGRRVSTIDIPDSIGHLTRTSDHFGIYEAISQSPHQDTSLSSSQQADTLLEPGQTPERNLELLPPGSTPEREDD